MYEPAKAEIFFGRYLRFHMMYVMQCNIIQGKAMQCNVCMHVYIYIYIPSGNLT